MQICGRINFYEINTRSVQNLTKEAKKKNQSRHHKCSQIIRQLSL
jgi:hypothetical protein